MNRDFSFLKLYKNDFASAKRGDDTPIVKLPYKGFIAQRPNELFTQITNCETDISFVGGITVELVDQCENVKANITSNFYYIGFIDRFGVQQIQYTFGFIGIDFYSTPLFLRITDNTNGNKWYSYNFLVTYPELSTRFDYYAPSEIYNISYDLVSFKEQSVRIVNCYDQTPVNEKQLTQYLKISGKQTNFRNITTYKRKYLIDNVDIFINDRLDAMFDSPFIYVDGQRVTVSDFQASERVEQSNFLPVEFTINPQGETLPFSYGLYQPFAPFARFVPNNSIFTLADFNSFVPTIGLYLDFNKTPNILPTFEYELWENNVLVLTSSAYSITGDRLYFDDLQTFTYSIADYSIVVKPNGVGNGIEFWQGYIINEWVFSLVSAQYASSDYNNDYLI